MVCARAHRSLKAKPMGCLGHADELTFKFSSLRISNVTVFNFALVIHFFIVLMFQPFILKCVRLWLTNLTEIYFILAQKSAFENAQASLKNLLQHKFVAKSTFVIN